MGPAAGTAAFCTRCTWARPAFFNVAVGTFGCSSRTLAGVAGVAVVGVGGDVNVWVRKGLDGRAMQGPG